MFTKLGLIGCVFSFLAVLSASGLIPTDKRVGAFIFTISLFVVGFLAAFKTEEVISPVFRSSRLGIVVLKVGGWLFIMLGAISLVGLVYFVLGLLRG